MKSKQQSMFMINNKIYVYEAELFYLHGVMYYKIILFCIVRYKDMKIMKSFNLQTLVHKNFDFAKM